MTATLQETTAPQSPVVEPLTDVERRARVLEAAALEIEVRGWGREQFDDNDGHVCIAGAIACAVGTPLPIPSDVGFLPAWKTWGGPLSSDIWMFNDMIAKSAAEVTFLLRWRAAELRDGWDAA